MNENKDVLKALHISIEKDDDYIDDDDDSVDEKGYDENKEYVDYINI